MRLAKPLAVLSLTLAIASVGCAAHPPAFLPSESALASRPRPATVLSGTVYWGDTARGVAASAGEIASGATVSLVDMQSGVTVATTVTAANGSFELAISNWTPTPGQPYALEAVKGLKTGSANANRVGASAARLRTVIAKVDGTWTSLTGSTIVIGISSTAIAVAAGLRDLGVENLKSLLSRLDSSTNAFKAAAGISTDDFNTVKGLVSTCLALNQDPVRAISVAPGSGAFYRRERLPVITDLSAASGKAGDQVVIAGNNFDLTAGNNVVKFGGVPASGVEVDAKGTTLTATLPANARTGSVTVTVAGVSASSPIDFAVVGGAGTIYRVAGKGQRGFSADGTRASEALLNWVGQPAVDADGILYFMDADNRLFRKIEPDGTLKTINAAVGLIFPTGLARDAQGNFYIGDPGLSKIFKISPANQVTTYAGNGQAGSGGDGGKAVDAQVVPKYLAVDSAGNLYFSEISGRRLRKISPNGDISSLAGNGSCGAPGDGGPPTQASLCDPDGVAVDGQGNVFVSEFSGQRVRKVSANGQSIETVAGTGSGGYSGDGELGKNARVWGPAGLAVDPQGNLYICDVGNNRVRKVAPDGIISTFAGSGASLGWTDEMPADTAILPGPASITFGPTGTAYISGGGTSLIWKAQ